MGTARRTVAMHNGVFSVFHASSRIMLLSISRCVCEWHRVGAPHYGPSGLVIDLILVSRVFCHAAACTTSPSTSDRQYQDFWTESSPGTPPSEFGCGFIIGNAFTLGLDLRQSSFHPVSRCDCTISLELEGLQQCRHRLLLRPL